jgi:hypothetical protein
MVRNDTDDFVSHVIYLLVHAQCDPKYMPPELIEEEQLQVVCIFSLEEEKRKYPGIEDALALFMSHLHSPPPPPRGPPPPEIPPRPRRSAWRNTEAWDPWPAPQPPALAWMPPTPGPPPPPMAAWPGPQTPFIDLSGDDDDGQV